jgi:hypothetical protein
MTYPQALGKLTEGGTTTMIRPDECYLRTEILSDEGK